MKVGTAVILLTCLLTLSLGQLNAAGFMPHFYTGTVRIANTTGLTSKDYVKVLDRTNVFTATQEVQAATALLDFSRGTVQQPNLGSTGVAHIEILNAAATSNKQAFQFTLRTSLTAPIITGAIAVKIFHLTLMFILVGQLFSGYSTTLPSQFIFPRNSDMLPAAATMLVPFKYGTLESPFMYTQGATAGCGAVKQGGKWVLQKICDKIIATIYLTGLQFKVATSGNAVNAQTIDPTTQQVDLTDPTKAPFATSGAYGVYVKNSLTTQVDKIQYSMIVIGIRDYTAQYSTQGRYPDDFITNTYLPAEIGTYTLATDTDPIAASGSAIPYINDFNPQTWSDRFCGLTQVKTTQAAFTTGTGVGFELISLDLKANTGQVNPLLQSTTVSNSYTETAGQNTFTYSCQLFVATTPTPTCTETPTNIPLDPTSFTSKVTTVTTPETTASAAPAGSATYISTDDPNYLGPAIVVATQSVRIANTITYTFKILNNPEVAVYQGILKLVASATDAALQNIKLQIFGNQILDVTEALATKLYHFAFINSNTANNQIVITYTLTKDAATQITQSLQFKLVKQGVVYKTDGTCGSVCNPVAGMSVGVLYAYTPPRCVYCDASVGLVFDPLNEVDGCTCKPGYVLDTNTGRCQPCVINLCATCTIDSLATDTCTQCVPHAALTTTTPIVCKCVAGYYQNPDPATEECLPCAPGCATCTNAQSCVTCLSSATRDPNSIICACLPGYYQVNQPDCVKCTFPCVNCTAETTCTACDTAGNYVLNGTQCVCKDGYYERYVSGIHVCLKCDPSCKTCSGDAPLCTQCRSEAWSQDTPNGICYCPNTVYLYNYQSQTVQPYCVNLKCSDIHPNCIECGVAFEPPKPVCRTCDPTKFMVPSTTMLTCVCLAGYIPAADGCVACTPYCQTCTASVCTVCAVGSTLTNGVCTPCKDGTYLQAVNNVLMCTACSANCTSCNVTSTNCTACKTGFTLDTRSRQCVCSPGKYLTADGNCVACMTGCSTCSNSTNCDQCLQGYVNTVTPTGIICQLTCAQGFYQSPPLCLQCPTGCLACQNQYTCTACAQGKYIYLGTCVAVCPGGTFPYVTGECIACAPTCRYCSGSPSQCVTCPDGQILVGGQCMTNCLPGTYYTNGNCQFCVGDCVTCVDTATKCLSCPAGKYLFNNVCYSTCPTYLIGSVCSPTCPAGRYFNGTACAPCQTTCATCDSFPTCLTCRAGVLYKGGCTTGCPANTVQIGSVCYDCDASCVGCTVQTTNCVQCAAGTYKFDTKCYAKCPDTYYPDVATMTCRKCDADCQVCQGPGRCQQCTSGAAPVGGLCSVSCGANCLACANGACTTCAPTYFWNGLSCSSFCPSSATGINGVCVCLTSLYLYRGTCIPDCPAGFYKANGECKACTSPCATCTTAADKCDTCISGYTYDAVNKRCIQNIACEPGKYPSNFGCRFICPQGNYYLDSACYEQACPSGYNLDSTLRICTKGQNTNGCTSPFFQQGVDCVLQCSPGFYPNVDNRICMPCSANCLVCSTALTCTSCAGGFTPYNGYCIIAGDPCAPGQFRSNAGCVSSCPYGTFGQDGYCIRRCGAGLYYWNGGCYETCPANLRTQDGCVVVCPTGFTPQNNVCVLSSPQQICNSGQFYNTLTRLCQNCRYPCASCSGSSTFCLTCVPAFTVRAGACISDNSCPAGSYPTQTGCQRCAAKCATCSDLNTCTSCAPNYSNTGSDCVQTNTNLQPVALQVNSVTKRDTTVFIQVKPSVLPNNLPTNLQSQVLIFVASVPVNATVVIWIQDGFIWVAVIHQGEIPTYNAILLLNSNVLASIYQSMGFTTNNVFAQASISPNVGLAPSTTVIPVTASITKALRTSELPTIYSLRLNSITSRAVSNIDKAS